MKYTIQDYQNVIDIVLGSTASEGLIAHCKAQIAELSKPVPKKFRCINHCPIIPHIKVGQDIGSGLTYMGESVSMDGFQYFFELIPEPVKVEPISMRDILFILEEACCMGEYSHRCAGLVKKIKADHNL